MEIALAVIQFATAVVMFAAGVWVVLLPERRPERGR